MAVIYRIEFAPAAARQFKKLPKEVQFQLKVCIDSLAEDPRPQGVVQLSGTVSLYRVRQGDYRVIYEIQDEALLVLVAGVGNRREIYRLLRKRR